VGNGFPVPKEDVSWDTAFAVDKKSPDKVPTGALPSTWGVTSDVLRGGTRSARRLWDVADFRLYNYGFRLVRELD